MFNSQPRAAVAQGLNLFTGRTRVQTACDIRRGNGEDCAKDLQVLRHTQQPVSIYPTRHGEQRAPAEPAFTGDRAAPGFCREASPCTGTADPRVASSCRVSAPCGPSAAGSMPSCAAASSAAAAASMNRIRSRSSGSAGFGYGMPRTTTHLRRGATNHTSTQRPPLGGI